MSGEEFTSLIFRSVQTDVHFIFRTKTPLKVKARLNRKKNIPHKEQKKKMTLLTSFCSEAPKHKVNQSVMDKRNAQRRQNWRPGNCRGRTSSAKESREDKCRTCSPTMGKERSRCFGSNHGLCQAPNRERGIHSILSNRKKCIRIGGNTGVLC